MTISKSDILVTGKFTKQGAPFAEIGANETVNSTGMLFLSKGLPFYGPNNTTTVPLTPVVSQAVRKGEPFLWDVGNNTVNASTFKFTTRGTPYYVASGVTYNTTQFFMVF